MLFASRPRLNLRQARKIYNRVSLPFSHVSLLTFFFFLHSFILFPSISLVSFRLFRSAFHMCPSRFLCFPPVTLQCTQSIKGSLVSIQYMCAMSARAHVCMHMCTDVSINMFVCERGLRCLGDKSTHKRPFCLDLYYSLPFAISSHSAAECEGELLENVDLFSVSI